jgi:hypothetical protein
MCASTILRADTAHEFIRGSLNESRRCAYGHAITASRSRVEIDNLDQCFNHGRVNDTAKIFQVPNRFRMNSSRPFSEKRGTVPNRTRNAISLLGLW